MIGFATLPNTPSQSSQNNLPLC